MAHLSRELASKAEGGGGFISKSIVNGKKGLAICAESATVDPGKGRNPTRSEGSEKFKIRELEEG